MPLNRPCCERDRSRRPAGPGWLGLVVLLLSAAGCASPMTPGQKVLFGDEPPPARPTIREVRRTVPRKSAPRPTGEQRAAGGRQTGRETDVDVAPLVLGQSPGLSSDGPDLGGGLSLDASGTGLDRWIRDRQESPQPSSRSSGSGEPTGEFDSPGLFGRHSSVHDGSESGEAVARPDTDPPVYLEEGIWERHVELGRRLWSDQGNFYDIDTLAPFALALGGAAILANSGIDREFAEDYQDNIFNDDTDKASSWVKWMGDGRYTLPILGVATAMSIYIPEDELLGPVGTWGQRSLRATITGALPLWVMQRAIGSGRPGLDANNSSWAFWDHTNGVSGHTFISAVPFITAARMVENPYAKAGLYLGSTLTGWSRINDHDHYLSQVLLGWFLAYLAVDSVFDTDTQAVGWHLVSIPPQHGQGIGLEYRY